MGSVKKVATCSCARIPDHQSSWIELAISIAESALSSGQKKQLGLRNPLLQLGHVSCFDPACVARGLHAGSGGRLQGSIQHEKPAALEIEICYRGQFKLPSQ